MQRNGVEGLIYNFCDQVAWEPKQSLSGGELLVRLANRALLQVSQDAPFLFTETTKTLFTIPTYHQTIEGDGVIGIDPWTLRRKLTTDDAEDWPSFGLKQWSGMVIRLQDVAGGPPLEARIRDVFTKTIDAEEYQCMTLWESVAGTEELTPPFSGHTEYSYKVYQREMFVPDDFTSINSIIIHTPQGPQNANFLSEKTAELEYLKDIQNGITLSWPYKFYRRGMFTLPAPTIQPTVELDEGEDAIIWNGEEPAGTFVYAYTVCFGFKDTRFDLGAPPFSTSTYEANVKPLAESPLSRISKPINVTYEDEGVIFTAPDIWYEAGFRTIQGTPKVRNNHSGMYITVYRARVFNTDVKANSTPLLVGDSLAFYRIGVIDESADLTLFYDDGSTLPDKSTPYIPSNGNQLLSLYPYPDNVYRVDIRGHLRPTIYNFLQDTSAYPPEADELILLKMLEYYYTRIASANQSNIERLKYSEQLAALKKKFALLGPNSRIINRLPAPGLTGDMVRHRKLWSNNGN